MTNRKPVARQTLAGIATELADIPVSDKALEGHLSALTPLMEEIDRLRALPLKDVEPALVYAPIEDGS